MAKPKRLGRRAVQGGLAALADLALPGRCAVCGGVGSPLCARCALGVREQLYARPGSARPDPCPPGLPHCVAVGAYAGALAAALTAYKDRDRRDLAPLLGALAGQALDGALAASALATQRLRLSSGPVLVVPVPSSARAHRRRGDAPLLTLARRATCGYAPDEAAMADALRLTRRVADQAGLGARERAANVSKAMAVSPGWGATVAGAACVLVDDVLTTGATLGEAARALRASGAAEVVAATVSATVRRHVTASYQPLPVSHSGGVV